MGIFEQSIFYKCSTSNRSRTPTSYLVRRIGPDGEKVFGPLVSGGSDVCRDVPRLYWRDYRDIIEVYLWSAAPKTLIARVKFNDDNHANYDKGEQPR